MGMDSDVSIIKRIEEEETGQVIELENPASLLLSASSEPAWEQKEQELQDYQLISSSNCLSSLWVRHKN